MKIWCGGVNKSQEAVFAVTEYGFVFRCGFEGVVFIGSKNNMIDRSVYKMHLPPSKQNIKRKGVTLQVDLP